MYFIKNQLLIVLLLFFLFSCNYKTYKSDNNILNTNKNYFIILPHHSITRSNIDIFYKNFSKKHKNIKNIVIISPNHFNIGKGFLNSFPKKSEYCFGKNDLFQQTNCIRGTPLSFYSLTGSYFNIFNFSIKQDKYFFYEHGIGEHIKYINKYLPNYQRVYSIILKVEHKFLKTRKLFNKLKNYNFGNGDTLFIASVDFSHHNMEKIAIFHDMKTIENLNNNKLGKVEVDCPNCLFLIKKLANYFGKDNFLLKNRTSSLDIIGKDIGYENTSHIFGEFIKDKHKKNNFNKLFSGKYQNTIFKNKENAGTGAIYGMFFGDTHLTRGFIDSKSFNNKKKYLNCFYQNKDLTKKPKYWINRMFFSFDFVGVNLETSVCEKKECQKSQKSIIFRTNPNMLSLFKEVGINLFNISNNHSYDCGDKCLQKTKENILKYKMNYFGEGRKKESNILKTNLNNLKIAFVGINDTTFYWNIQDKIKKIKELKKKNYLVIVNIHFGGEYQKERNKRQKILAHKLVDIGVNMIIGHHPHVIQRYEIYKGTPIFYSLGNFIFDQYDKNTLKGIGVVYRIDNFGIKFNTIYFERNPYNYRIICDTFK